MSDIISWKCVRMVNVAGLSHRDAQVPLDEHSCRGGIVFFSRTTGRVHNLVTFPFSQNNASVRLLELEVI